MSCKQFHALQVWQLSIYTVLKENKAALYVGSFWSLTKKFGLQLKHFKWYGAIKSDKALTPAHISLQK